MKNKKVKLDETKSKPSNKSQFFVVVFIWVILSFKLVLKRRFSACPPQN